MEAQGQVGVKEAFVLCRDEPAIVWKILWKLADEAKQVQDLSQSSSQPSLVAQTSRSSPPPSSPP